MKKEKEEDPRGFFSSSKIESSISLFLLFPHYIFHLSIKLSLLFFEELAEKQKLLELCVAGFCVRIGTF